MDETSSCSSGGFATRRVLVEAFGWTALALGLEVVLGWAYAGSTALLADAGHLSYHAGAIGIALVGVTLGFRKREPERRRSTERRACRGIGLLMVAVAPLLLWEACGQLLEPSEIRLLPMAGTALAGLSANARVLAILGRCPSHLARGVALCTRWDLVSSVGVLVCSALLALGVSLRLDGLTGAIVGVGVFVSGVRLIVDTVEIS